MKKIGIKSMAGLLVLFSIVTYSQENGSDLKKIAERKNAIDLTIGGNGLFASVNYNRILIVRSYYFINASVGIGTLPLVGGFTLPHLVTCNTGKRSSFLELGIGGSYWSGKSNASGYTERNYSYQLSPIIGWRKHFKSNLIFRAYVNPLIHVSGEYYIEDYPVIPYFGISLGYGF